MGERKAEYRGGRREEIHMKEESRRKKEEWREKWRDAE